MNINQTSQRAVVNWDSFNVGKNAQVNFNQPNASAATLNRVTGATASMIDGAIRANGQVILVNPNGVTFGKGAEINAAAVVASTMNIANKDFMDGKSTYKGNGKGAVVNEGKISVNDPNGYIALLAPEIRNEGYLLARKGPNNAVALASGEQITLDFRGDQLISVNIDKAAYGALIENKRIVEVKGGLVVVAAGSANQLMGSVIKNTGRISASSMVNNGGVIELVAANVTQAGTVAANGKGENSKGGQVNIVGENITLAQNSKTTATGKAGGGSVEVGLGRTQATNTNQAPVQEVAKVASVLTTTASIDTRQAAAQQVAAVASQTKQIAKTVTVQDSALVDVSSTQKGDAGNIVIWSEVKTTVNGILKAVGGSLGGNGGFVETSSKGTVNVGKQLVIDTSAAKGKSGLWFLDPIDLIIDASAANVISSALTNNNVTIAVNGNVCPSLGSCTQNGSGSLTLASGADILKQGGSLTTLKFISSGIFNLNANISGANLNVIINSSIAYLNVGTAINASQVTVQAQTIYANGTINAYGVSNATTPLGAAIQLLAQAVYVSGRLNVASNTNTSNNTNTNSNTITYNGNVIRREDIPTFLTAQNNATTALDVVYSTTAANDSVADRVNTQTNVIYLNAVREINLFSTAEIKANGTTGGYINLTAQAFNAQSGSLIQANGNNGPGGDIHLTTSDVHLSGAISANGTTGGSFALSANSAQFDGTATIQTNGSNGPGGTLSIDVSQDINIVNSGLYVNGTSDGGSIRILSRAGNLSLFDSLIQTNGGNGRGGSIGISAFNNTTLTNTVVEATGFTQGGHILIGNDAQNHTLPFSIFTQIDANSSIRANQTNSLETNNGGFIETSGQAVSLLACINAGIGGLWLIDPNNITIGSGTTSGGSLPSFTAGASSSIVNVLEITNALNAGNNVTISTADGYIDITQNIVANSNANLTITAQDYIWISSGVKIWLNSTSSTVTGTYTPTDNSGSLIIGGPSVRSLVNLSTGAVDSSWKTNSAYYANGGAATNPSNYLAGVYVGAGGAAELRVGNGNVVIAGANYATGTCGFAAASCSTNSQNIGVIVYSGSVISAKNIYLFAQSSGSVGTQIGYGGAAASVLSASERISVYGSSSSSSLNGSYYSNAVFTNGSTWSAPTVSIAGYALNGDLYQAGVALGWYNVSGTANTFTTNNFLLTTDRLTLGTTATSISCITSCGSFNLSLATATITGTTQFLVYNNSPTTTGANTSGLFGFSQLTLPSMTSGAPYSSYSITQPGTVTISSALYANTISLTTIGQMNINANLIASATGGTVNISAGNFSTSTPTITATNVNITETSVTSLASINTNLINGSVNLNNNGSLQLTTPANSYFALNAAIAGAGGATAATVTMTSSNQGTIQFGGNNTYTGVTTINGGTLALGASNVLANTSAVTINGGTFALGSYSDTVGAVTIGEAGGSITSTTGVLTGSSYTFNNTSSATVSAVLGGAANLTQAGNGTTTLSGNSTYTGLTTVSAGTLKFAPSSTFSMILSGGITNNADVFYEGANSAALFFDGAISGAGAWTINSASSNTAFNNRMIFRGTGAIASGQITVTNYGNFWLEGASINITSAIYLNGADTYLRLYGGVGVTIKTGTITGNGTVDFSSGGGGKALTLSVGNDNRTGSFSGLISNSGVDAGPTILSIVKAGTGTWTLSGANTYTGATTISAGILSIRSDGNLGAVPGSVTANSIALAGGALQATSNVALNSYRGITLTADSGLAATSSTTLIYAGAITGGYALTINGASQTGTVSLVGANTYTGGTTLSSGTLGVYSNGSLGNGALSLAGSTTLLLGRAVTDITNDISLTGNATVAFDTNVDYLIVAGGGSGGVGRGGGGGAGGVLTGTTSLANSSYALTVGAGGAAVVNDQRGLNGGDSSLGSVATATGGGGGGGWTACGGLGGGSGGGASGCGGSGGAGVAGQGYAGATVAGVNQNNGGGGGGAGAVASGANGGVGVETYITGSSLWVGGGGGAGSILGGGTPGTGGTGGGANGKNQITTGNSGTANTGGGGGGVEGYAGTSGAGGSGVIIVRYLGPDAASGGTESSGTGTATGYSLHTFTSTGSLTFNSISAKLSGVISGANRLTVAATPGTLSLTSANTYSGGTTISSGTLQVGNGGTSGNLGSGSVTNNAALVFNRSNDFTISNAISGTGALTKNGAGALTLSYANTYTGATTISAGSLTAGIANAIAQSASVTLSDVSGAVFNLGGFDQGIKNLSGGGSTGGNIILGSNLLTITQTSGTNYGGVISGADGQLTKLGNSQLTLTGSNTYTGATTINAGTLKIGAAGGVIANASAVVVGASGTLDVYYSETVGSISGSGTIYTQSPSSNIVLTMGGNDSSTTFSGNLSMGQTALGYVKIGTGTLTLDGTSTFPNYGSSVAFDINGGAVLLGSSGAFGNLTSNSNAKIGFGGGTLKYSSSNTTDYSGNFKTTSGQAISIDTNGQNVTFTSNLTSSSGTLTKLGSGALTLGGTNTYAGGTTVSAGTLKAGSATAFGGSAGAITVADGATLDLNGKTLANTNALTLNGAGVSSAGSLTNSSGTAGTYAGAITLGSAAAFGSTSEAITVSGVISDASDYGLAIIGNKAVTLSSTSNTLKTIATGSAVGALTIVNTGDLAISSVTVGGTTYTGLNSTGTISVKTTGDLTISQNVSTTSTSAVASAPALLLAAGYDQAAGTVTKNIKLSGSPTFTVGSGGIVDFYSGDSSGSTGLTAYVDAQSPKSYTYSATLSTQPTAAGYNVIYRGAPPYIYLTIVDSQTGTYGTASGLSYWYSTSPTLYGSAYLPSSLSSFNSAQTFTAGQSTITINSGGLTGTIDISTALTTTTNANTYSMTLSPTLALSGSSVVFVAGAAKNFVLNPKSLNIAISKTYDGNATFTNTNTYALTGMANSESAPTISSGSATLSSANVTSSAATSFASNSFALSSGNYTLTGGTVSASISQLSSVTYTGSAGGSWSDGTNWTAAGTGATGATPTLANVATVVIPVSASVSYGDSMAGLAPTGAVGITNNGGISFANTSALTMPATISGGGTVTMAGSAAVTFTATNTYTGTTTINNGATLKLGSATSISNSSALVIDGTL
ncbi:autotransporter-associated beta strand repeat-containing protein, partial [Polynucleobacter sp. MWH-Jannik1A5]|uniref:autotransporter-associated beta strand repeat-containing protein n=1 Tax=Polynucleobacter sp. MWH-Jannik1A5 TaxID=1855890 RepID=UPI001C0D7FB1